MSYIINLMTKTLNFYNIKGTEIVGQHAQVVQFMPTDMVNVAAEILQLRELGMLFSWFTFFGSYGSNNKAIKYWYACIVNL